MWENREGGSGCETACESMRVTDTGRGGVGGWAQLYLAGKEGMENGRERDGGHFFFLEQRFILGWIGFRKGHQEVLNTAKNPDSLQHHYHQHSRVVPAHQDCTLHSVLFGLYFLSLTSLWLCPKHNRAYVILKAIVTVGWHQLLFEKYVFISKTKQCWVGETHRLAICHMENSELVLYAIMFLQTEVILPVHRLHEMKTQVDSFNLPAPF